MAGRGRIRFSLAQGNSAQIVLADIAAGETPTISTEVEAGETVQAPVDDTLTKKNAAADAYATGKRIAETAALIGGKMDMPEGEGADGQYVRKDGDKVIWATVGTPTQSQVETIVNTWLDEHPEATTSVQDGSISYQKLAMALRSMLDGFVDGGYVEEDSLYLTHNGEVVAGPFSGIGGGGGGGGGGSQSTAEMKMENVSGWTAQSVPSGGNVTITISWSSIEDEMPTGNGTLTVKVNGVNRERRDVVQGEVTIDVSAYLIRGDNSIQISVTDGYGNTRMRNFSVSVVELSITSSFDENDTQTGALVFPYTAYGEVQKTVYFLVDGVTAGTEVTSESGRGKTYTIAAQSHGAHTIDVYFTATLNGQEVESNHLHFDVIWIVEGAEEVIVASSWNTDEVNQYTTINMPYRVYDPTNQMASVVISVDGTAVSTLASVDRTAHTFSYRMDTTGEHTVTIASGGASKSFTITVNAVDIDVHAATDQLGLYLSSSGRNNSEESPGTWHYGEGAAAVDATFTGFNWASDGWLQDSDGITALRVSGDARVTIPYKAFARDFRTTGKTIEIEFATRDVLDYDAVIVSCMNGGRGFQMTAQSFSLSSEQSGISMQFKEEEHVRVGFVVEKRSGFRRIYCYINGVVSGVTQYPADDNFQQGTPQDITIGSDGCTVDIYCIRIYDTDLSSQQMEDNWIADTQDGQLMVNRYQRNNVRDAYGKVNIAQLPSDLPYMIIEGAELPQYKGDKKTVDISFVHPMQPAKSFTALRAQIDVQGTSSQYYERKNYKVKYKNGFVNAAGNEISKYQLTEGCLPTNVFCYKADVASSEGANNVELVRLYNDTCPYKTPAQVSNRLVRQGIDGYPIVIFWRNTANDTTTFLGKYNANLDKGSEECFGFESGDESWEVKNNTGNRVLFKSADYSGTDWLNDFEARYPDTDPPYTDSTQLAEFATWMVSVDPDQATGDTLAQPVTIVDGEDETTYTADTAAYRKAKFRAELSEYMEVDSALYYYLFTELFLMVDSRAKNMFPSFIGSTIS